MKESVVGFLVVAGLAAWFLVKHAWLLKPLLFLGGVLLGLFLIAFITWYGFVQIRIWLRI
jgi:hypothetical protein